MCKHARLRNYMHGGHRSTLVIFQALGSIIGVRVALGLHGGFDVGITGVSQWVWVGLLARDFVVCFADFNASGL